MPYLKQSLPLCVMFSISEKPALVCHGLKLHKPEVCHACVNLSCLHTRSHYADAKFLIIELYAQPLYTWPVLSTFCVLSLAKPCTILQVMGPSRY